MSKKIYIIDGYNFLYRVFYAIPPFSLKDGTPVNAVFGMAKILLALHTEDKPDYLIFTLDAGSKARLDLYPEYKATRDRMPDNLRIQEGIIMEMLEVMGIEPLKIEGYEADDIIGTLVTKIGHNGFNGTFGAPTLEAVAEKEVKKPYEMFILSGDKDLYQFINGNVAIYDTMKKKIYHEADAREKFWVAPEHIVDYLAICGDSSDNIPGIPGFGPKKAESLINAYGNLEAIYENLASITGKTHDVLVENKEVAFLSKQLATIDIDAPMDGFSLEAHSFAARTFITPQLIDFFTRHDFRSLVPKGHMQTKDITSLPIKQRRITNQATLDICIAELKKIGKVSLASHGERFGLTGGTLYFWGPDIYVFETNVINMKPFFQEALSGEYEILGYDLKKDLERIEAYLEGETANATSGQMGLF